MDIIPKNDLKAGHWYRGTCRNANVALWTGKHFIYMRNKFGQWFTETINHPEDDNGFDLFRPVELLHAN